MPCDLGQSPPSSGSWFRLLLGNSFLKCFSNRAFHIRALIGSFKKPTCFFFHNFLFLSYGYIIPSFIFLSPSIYSLHNSFQIAPVISISSDVNSSSERVCGNFVKSLWIPHLFRMFLLGQSLLRMCALDRLYEAALYWRGWAHPCHRALLRRSLIQVSIFLSFLRVWGRNERSQGVLGLPSWKEVQFRHL